MDAVGPLTKTTIHCNLIVCGKVNKSSRYNMRLKQE